MATLYQAPGKAPTWGVPAVRSAPSFTAAAEAVDVTPRTPFTVGKSLGKAASGKYNAAKNLVASGNAALGASAALGYLGNLWGQYRGAQMDADPLIQNELSRLNALNRSGIIYDDEGNALDANTFQPVSDKVVENTAITALLPSEIGRGTWEDKANPAFALTDAEALARAGLDTWDFKAKPKQNKSGQQGTAITVEEGKGNWMDGLTGLLGLLALGGGAYYLGKKL